MTGNESNNTIAHDTAAERPFHRDYREERRAWRREQRDARRTFPYHGMFPGMLLVLLGVLFLMDQAGILTGGAWWQYLLIGLGAISIVSSLVRYRSYRWGSYTSFIFGAILVAIGTIFMLGLSQWWPIVLIVAGAALLLRFFWR